MLISVIWTEIKDSSLSFVDWFLILALFLKHRSYIKLNFLDNCPKTKIHQSHHSFFSIKSSYVLLLLRVFDADLSVCKATAKHVNNLELNIWKNRVFCLRLLDYFFILTWAVKAIILQLLLGTFQEELFHFFGEIFFPHLAERFKKLL